MEVTKGEAKTLILAVGTAIEHEKAALEDLRNHNTQEFGVSHAINDRERHIAELEKIRKRLIAGETG
jgi:hypothetical protein